MGIIKFEPKTNLYNLNSYTEIDLQKLQNEYKDYF